MEPFTSLGGTYGHGPPSWHHARHFDPSFYDDSGYSSEDSDRVEFPPLSPEQNYRNTDQLDNAIPKTRRHRASAFVGAQWSRPADLRPYYRSHNSSNDSWRAYDLPRPLAFEQQRNSYEPSSRPKPPAYHDRETFGREPAPPASRWGLEENISPLDVEDHRARVPDTLPSLSNRIENDTDPSSPPFDSIPPFFPTPRIDPKAPSSSRGYPTAAPGQIAESLSARRFRRNQSSSRDTALAAAWQQLYEERLELEKEKRASREGDEFLARRKE